MVMPDSSGLMDENTEYCNKHKVFQLLEGMMARLIVEKPDDPIGFLISALQTDKRPRVILTSVDSSLAAVQAMELSHRYGLVVVDADAVVNDIASTGVAAEAAKYVDSGEPIPDDLLVQALTEQMLSDECQQKGWVLVNFPRTLEQAQLLLAMGNLPTLHVSIQTDEDAFARLAETRRYDPEDPDHPPYTADQPPGDPNVAARLETRPEDEPEAIAASIADYHRTQRSMASLWAQVAFSVDGRGSDADVAERLGKLLSAPAPTRAPRPAPAVALVGPPGSGTAEQAARLSAKFGAVLVSADELVETAVAHGTELGAKAKVYKETDAPVPDEIMCQLVLERLAAEDCRRHGWLLEGFPRTSAQALALTEKGVHVRELLVLELADEAAISAITSRRIDPVSGKAYHLGALPADAPAGLEARLVQHPRDTREVAERRLKTWSTGKPGLIAHFKAAAHKLDASVDPDELFERLCPFLLRMDERHLL